MNWSEIPFGKYAGRPLPQVALTDPDYFFRMCEEPRPIWPSKEFGQQLRLLEEASRRIAPPDEFGACGTHVAYHAHRGSFLGVSLVPSQMVEFVVPRGSLVLPHFDLSVARETCPDDREGSQTLVREMLHAIYGGQRRRTRKFCAEFFEYSPVLHGMGCLRPFAGTAA